jgi:hypothetical protein
VNKSRRLRWAGHVAGMGERRGAYRVLVEKPEGRRPFGRRRHRWEDNIKMDPRELCNRFMLSTVSRKFQITGCVLTVIEKFVFLYF